MVQLEYGAMIDIDRSTHGSPYEYDRKVPLLFYGRNVPAGLSDVFARTVDVAPTLSLLAGVPIPTDVDGAGLTLRDE